MPSRLPLRDRAQGRWLGILPALGISESFLTGNHGPCPLCGGKDRWRWDNLEARGTWICSRCGAGDGIALVMQKNGWEFREAAKQIDTVIGSVPTDAPKRDLSDREKRDAMNKLWQSSKAVEANDPVGSYLAWRVGLTSFPPCLRTASHLRYQADRPSFHPAMIAMVSAPDGAPSTLHQTYLTVDGRKASVDPPRRMMPGTVAKGSAIRLAPAGDALGIAEGIETALSASALFDIPCWAAVNAGMLAAWQPHSRLSASSSLATTMRVIPARPRLMHWPDGSGPSDSSSRFRSRRSPKPTGMMCTGCGAVEAKFLSARPNAAQGAGAPEASAHSKRARQARRTRRRDMNDASARCKTASERRPAAEYG
jgi:putative DNA primase/helicase